ncbi:hypothetical protein QYE76_015871 [Lolium multiflorum]|uniref:Casein kinase substrate phosphoprotein PP28 domain-containing protein n=1 Tax=Lolium multiflorum TaxID=4521 RepID=A0AAD8U7B8_LOLMU|nr:hypothetical protein QYE76_015871 [Lolium multiflorum]
MARGKFKGKPTGERTFSSEEELGTYAMLAPYLHVLSVGDLFHADAVFSDPSRLPSSAIGVAGRWLIGSSFESRAKREEIEKQRSILHYKRLQEEGKTDQARKDLDRLSLIRQERAEAAKKREEEKAAKEERKAEARK